MLQGWATAKEVLAAISDILVQVIWIQNLSQKDKLERDKTSEAEDESRLAGDLHSIWGLPAHS